MEPSQLMTIAENIAIGTGVIVTLGAAIYLAIYEDYSEWISGVISVACGGVAMLSTFVLIVAWRIAISAILLIALITVIRSVKGGSLRIK